MGESGDRQIDPVKLRLMRIADGAGQRDYSLSGRKKEGGYARRKPSMPKTPWDDRPDKPDEK